VSEEPEQQEDFESNGDGLKTQEDHGFPCDECGASMGWDPAEGKLSCKFCGHHRELLRGNATILERALADTDSAERGLGVELLVTQCDTCGARVSFDGTATAQQCVYCGSANVLQQEANRHGIRPESLLPLDVGRGQVEANFLKWIGALWFRPNALKRIKRFDATGIYVPFWTFDAQVHSEWSAESGTHYYVTETYTTQVDGKAVVRTRQVQKTRWRPAWGQRDDDHDDHLVLGAKGQPADLVKELGSFELKGLVPYQPGYLAGWRAEEYSIDLEEAWGLGKAGIVSIQRERCSGDVPGDTQRGLTVQNQISEVHWKHILLPIWSLQYKFKGEIYTVLIHGQSGEVVGKAPYSAMKIVFAVLLVVGMVLSGIALAQAQ
jgi:DNA-directed RNA polymerase subunit RPC12/RpoP